MLIFYEFQYSVMVWNPLSGSNLPRLFRSSQDDNMKVIKCDVGDWVIYRKQKHSESPGPRAELMHPHQSGEEYTYIVEKYWVVESVNSDGELTLVTRKGKRHVIRPDDPRLRKPGLIQRWLLAERFREVEKALEE
jgi:hypothetical protein